MISVKTKKIRTLPTSWLEGPSDRVSSQAPILFFLHGFPDDATIWEKQLEFFAKKYVVAAPFARGSRPEENTNDKSRYGQESILLDHLDILHSLDPDQKRKVVVIGHDMGSPVGWNLARALKERCHGLVILNGASLEQMGLRLKNFKQLLKSWYILAFQFPMAERFWKMFEPTLIQAAHKKGGLEESHLPHKPTHLEKGLWQYQQAFKDTVKFFFKEQRKLPPKISTPVLVLCSKNDPFLEPTSIDEMENLAHHYTVRYVEGGHWAQVQKADKINSLIQKFIETIYEATPHGNEHKKTNRSA